MRKSTLFISAVLTTFVLVVLFGVVSAYKGLANSSQGRAADSAPTDAPVALADTPVAPTAAATSLTPEQAAALAAQVLGRTDLLSVETAPFNGATVYLVKFISGDQVYVSPEGTILSVVAAPAPVYVSAPSGGNDRPRNGGGGRGGGGGGGEGGGDHGGGDD